MIGKGAGKVPDPVCMGSPRVLTEGASGPLHRQVTLDPGSGTGEGRVERMILGAETEAFNPSAWGA